MKALFVHDYRFFETEKGVYSNDINYKVFRRYLTVFDELTVVGRHGRVDQETSSSHRNASGPGVSFSLLPNISSPRAFLGLRGRVARTLRRLIDSHDVVIFRLPSELGLLAASIARRCGRNYTVELVACSWDSLWNYGTSLARIYAPAQYLRVRRAIWRARFVVYVTEHFLQSRYPPNSSSLTTSISNVEIPVANEDTRISLKRVIRSRDCRLRIGVIGSMFVRYKGIDTGIDAIGKLTAMGHDVELRVLGGGNVQLYADRAKRLGIFDRVIFDGTLPAGDPVFSWLDEIDIYIQPSLQEGLPRALIEAMSRGCPAVGSIAGGIPELLPTEFVFKPKESDHLAEILDRMIVSEAIRVQASRRNHERAQDYRSDVLNESRHAFLSNIADHAKMERCGAG